MKIIFVKFVKIKIIIPLPPLNIHIPPSRPSNILFLLSVGLLSVFIQTPAMALSNISFCSSNPRPLLYTRTPPFWPPHILFPRITGLLPVLLTGKKFSVKYHFRLFTTKYLFN